MKRAAAMILAVLLVIMQLLPVTAELYSDRYQVYSDETETRGYHTVRFVADGEVISTIFVADGGRIESLPDAPGTDGKEFLGWYDVDSIFTAETIIRENKDIEAKYKEVQAEADFIFQSGTVYLKDIASALGISIANNSTLSVDNPLVSLSATTVKNNNKDNITLTAEGYFNCVTLTIRKNKNSVQTVTLAWPEPESKPVEDTFEDEAALAYGTLYYNEHIYLIGKIPGNGIVDVAPVTVSIDGEEVLAAYDIKIYANENQRKKGRTWQPAGKKVQVHFFNEAFTGRVNIYHIDGAAPEYVDTVAAENGWVEFEAGSFSTYAVTRTIEKNVLASDGHNYHITATFGPETGIPEDAELEASEITEGFSAYGRSYREYVTYTENALGMKKGSADYIRLFDISIVDKNDRSVKYQPAEGTAVDVRIELADSRSERLSVVHFADQDDRGSIVAAKTDGQAVSFTADGFSVYSVVSQESGTGNTSLDGKTYALVTLTNALMLGEPHPSASGRLNSMAANPAVGGTLLVNRMVTTWTFEAVEGRPGWYYISDGNGHYINITRGNGNGGTVTLGGRQPIYAAIRRSGSNTLYQLRDGEASNNTRAVNNYNNNTADGFGAWTASSGANNDWFRLYNIEYLGDYSVTFNANGGNEAAPPVMWGLEGNSIILPDYTGTRSGYTFIGWSTGTNLGGNNSTKTDYYPLYPAGSEYTIPDSNTTLYAVWNSNSPATAEFYIRLDGRIPYEPGRYDSSDYTGRISITGAIKEYRWVIDNDATKPNNGINIVNEVTARLGQVPSVDQIVANLNASSASLGFRVENRNGEVVVSQITNASTNRSKYNLSVGDALYVLWYVQKKESTWHVDGVLLVKNKVNIAYDGNAPGSVSDVPMGYQEDVGTVVTIGASGSKNGSVKTPKRPGYIFLGWNLKPDGSGTWYYNNDRYTLNEDTTLYAQWSKGTNMMTVSKTNEDGETLAGAQFKLEEKTSSGSYIEKANRTTGANGTFTYDQMENDTLYRMTETYAPNGYEVQNSFFFKVAVDSASSTALNLHVCDENGNFIEEPDWLNIEYIPASDPTAQGVARIRFNIRDERIKRSITFIKTDENGNPLSGAEYTLTGSKGVVSGVLKDASGSDGIFSVNNAVLPYGSYTLTEDKAPVTYAIGDPVTFTLNDYISAQNTGLIITGGNAVAECTVSSVTEQGLTTTTYAYTVTVKDVQQAHIIVRKAVTKDEDLDLNDLNTTIYYALTKKGTDGYVRKGSGEIWIESMDIVNGVPTPAQAVFDGVDFGEYDVWEMALIDGEYTRMYNGLVISEKFQLSSVSASSADGGNNANVSAEDLEGLVQFTNHYSKPTEDTEFIANKRWTGRDGTTPVDPPEGAVIEFTLYSEKKDASGQIIDGTLKEVRSVELDGVHDPDGEDSPWQATFKYLPIYYEGDLEYSYKVKETGTVDGYYPNDYPQEYYLTSSGGTITNRKLTTDVELHKHFELFPEDASLLSSMQGLAFTLTGPDGSETAYTIEDFAADDADPYDYVLTLHDLPLGEYSFAESGQQGLFSSAGYDLVYSVSSTQGEAEAGGTEQPVLALTLENSYTTKGSLNVKKNSIIHEAVDVPDVPAEISGKSFTFAVKRGSLYLQEDGTLSTSPYQFSLREGESRQFSDIPAGEYTVIESDASAEGYVWDVPEGTPEEDGSYSKSLIINGEQGTGEASFDNRYTRIENASLTVNKDVTGGPEEADTKSYQVEITTERRGRTMWLDADGSLTTEQTVLSIAKDTPLSFPSVHAGTYTIVEDEADAAFEEYSLEVSYSMENPFTLHKDSEISITITNAYSYLFTPVKIAKKVTGNMADPNLHFGFEVYVTDADDQPIVVENVTDETGKIQFSIKDGENQLIEKLPKGAKLTIIEHNEHYETTIEGVIGVNDTETESSLTGTSSAAESGTDTTATYAFTIPDEGATVIFTNNSNQDLPTGIRMDSVPYLMLIGLALAGCAALAMLNRRRRKDIP